MDLLIKAIILGIIEGITEFLPISSTGHLIIANRFIEFTGDFANMFDIVIQLGAILSVVVYFWQRLYPFSTKKNAAEKQRIWMLWKKSIVGVLPALAIGGVFGDKVEALLFNPTVVAAALVIGGVVLWWLESSTRRATITAVELMPWHVAVAIGFIQCLAMVPGTSRSAATIIGAMLLGLSRPAAAEFSFFLAIPTMAAASAYSLLKANLQLTVLQWQALAVGFLISFLVAWAVIAFFMNYIRNHNFKPFAYYRVVLAIVIFVLLAKGVLV
jgi:undecaprenyl-diphosphatase